MTERESIEESIQRITHFPVGYPRLIENVDEKWRAFFEWEYELCNAKLRQLNNAHGDNVPVEQMKML